METERKEREQVKPECFVRGSAFRTAVRKTDSTSLTNFFIKTNKWSRRGRLKTPSELFNVSLDYSNTHNKPNLGSGVIPDNLINVESGTRSNSRWHTHEHTHYHFTPLRHRLIPLPANFSLLLKRAH